MTAIKTQPVAIPLTIVNSGTSTWQLRGKTSDIYVKTTVLKILNLLLARILCIMTTSGSLEHDK
jgi:O-antigen/teichoic acid export membrane protein